MLSGTWLSGGSYGVLMSLTGSTSRSFSHRSPCVAPTGRPYVKVRPWHKPLSFPVVKKRLQFVCSCNIWRLQSERQCQMATAVYIIQPFVCLYNFVFNDDYIFIQNLVRFFLSWFNLNKFSCWKSSVYLNLTLYHINSFKHCILAKIKWHRLIELNV